MDDENPPGLPDLLREGLKVVFVGINPSIFSASQGHYFARKTNRFWPAFSRSVLSLAAREAIGASSLGPTHDRALLDHGFGFTDMVARPTARASELNPAEFAAGAPLLIEKLERYRPGVACFHGMTAYRIFHRMLGVDSEAVLGAQPLRIAGARLFVVPNPSPANAHSSPADQTLWYDRLWAFVMEEAER
ncbi:mismatch-specific DNA-glycosylase [Methylocella tundrae]|uniref:Uracil-DNA glycosylase superfamily n=1 Tax=Methylocella tundrae TaxID=227605 RepID=A0A4U8Z4Z9_METTU|nr:mismatch-specific DNA-glycosylase [Methylocella tundrae]WPP04240.1 mismatch-specific DNA-glycosylase [Methylocella tundrae]VFU10555.1 Uracil-DNA glycosylase superfamily [Methylocella tundrae]